MFKFTIGILDNDTFRPIDGTPVFPLGIGELLDERLNEAYVTVVNSTTPVFQPCTEVIVTVNDGSTLNKSYYFIVARDDASEMPIGSGMYKHDLYLIERTKLLEGVLGQTVTFTNTSVNVYTKNSDPATPYIEETNIGGIEFDGCPLVVSPIPLGVYYRIPSAKAIGDYFAEKYTDDAYEWKVEEVGEDAYERMFYTCFVYGGEETRWDNSKDILVTGNNLAITYRIAFSLNPKGPAGSISQIYAFITYDLAAVPNKYPMPRLTIADCINRCLELSSPVYYGEKRKYYLDPTQEEEYAKVIAPEFTMTQATLREQLKTIGGYIHAEPRLLGGNDEVTLADGTRAKRSQIIRFDKLGVSTVANAPTTYVGNSLTYDINQYCTQIDSTAQNIVNALNWAQGVVVSPSNNGIRTPRTETVNIRVQESNANVPTSFPIQSIRKVECGIITSGSDETVMYDITPYVFEQTEYDANLTSYKGAYPRSKAYAIYYTIGQKNLKGIFYKASTELSEVLGEYWTFYSIVNILSKVTGEKTTDIRAKFEGDYVGRLAFRVSYIPIYQTRVSHGKQYAESGQEYTQVYNQSENIIEARYYGENIKGAAARLGNIEQSRTYIVKDLADIPKVGVCVNVGTEETPNLYAVSGVNAQIFPEHIKFSLALTKDFNRISEYVGISSVKRVYEVSERNAYLRNVLLKEYAVVGKSVEKETSQPCVFRDYSALLGTFAPDATDAAPVTTVSQVYAWGGIKGTPVGEDATPLTKVALPVISSAFGNAMVFSWNYKDNYSAGEQVEYQSEKNVSGWWQQDVPYCDYYGRIEWMNFALIARESEDRENGASARNGAARRLPQLYSQKPTTANIGTNGTPYHIVKDSREIIQMNFELEFKSNLPYLIIGSALASNCPLVNAESKETVLCIFKDGRKIGKFDRTVDTSSGTEKWGDTAYELLPDGLKIEFSLYAASHMKECSAWAIITNPSTTTIDVDDGSGGKTTQTIYEGGEILIACNDPARFYKEHGSTVYITLVKNL
jgi:hypothetical protein